MHYYLMNKDHKVLEALLDTTNNNFTQIIQKIEFQYAPLALVLEKNDLLAQFNYWYHRRYLPDYRMNFYDLLENLDLFELYDYHETYYSFNMSDHYWVKPVDSGLQYIDIEELKNHILPNFYQAGLLQKSNPLSTYADPNITTEGILPKAWVNLGDKKLLVKGYLMTELEPYNEVLAYMIGKKLGMDVIEYQLEIIDGHVFSTCESFIDEDVEIISAEDILTNYDQEYNLENYISLIQQHGLDVSKHMNDMYLLDYLIQNTDRHMHNYGVIRNVETLEWIKPCPLYDHGTSLLSKNEIEPKYFNQKDITYDFILSLIEVPDNLDDLNDVFENFRKLCQAYPIGENTVEKMIMIVQEQISNLKKKRN